jgi:hypothetical protein
MRRTIGAFASISSAGDTCQNVAPERKKIMKRRSVFHGPILLAVFLALTSTALASNTWYVDGVNGNDNNNCTSSKTACKTIGHAISLASKGDSVMVAAATYTENITIGFSLKIVGSGASTTIIDGGGVNVVVRVSSRTHVILSGLTIQNGHTFIGGGGIDNAGTLTINDSTISGNTSGVGAGISNNRGGELTINKSTLSGNSASVFLCILKKCRYFGVGGGILNGGTLTINNSTLTGNSAVGNGSTQGGGGGISNGGTLTINNSTLAGNRAPYGGGILNNGRPVTLQNSIVANSPSGGNCSGPMTSNGYNLSSDNTCNFTGPGDMNNTDPKIGTLGNHGGPTQTIPLLAGSPAIDAGNPNGCTDGKGHLLKTDQRGKPRPDHEDTGGCDMGAYERQSD